jgi:amidase
VSPMSTITAAQSNAFVETFEVAPDGPGPLDGLRFAVKDLIDVAGRKTGCGNPAWRDTHPPAVAHAVCVEQLLRAGAACAGKTVTDELAFSLVGQNHFYGTPLNPRAPGRVPGGSSSGSASAVACGLVDFALGTDTGGSVRVPASNCGLFGLRPSHGVVSVAGVLPFAPTFDTVGLFTRSAGVLARAASVLLSLEGEPGPPGPIHLVREAFDLADAEVRQALEEPVRRLRERFGQRVREASLGEVGGEADFAAWADTYCVVQWAEIHSSLGAWVADAQPAFGPATAANFELTRRLDRRRVAEAARRREGAYRRLRGFLGPDGLLCLPTTPALAPRKGEDLPRSSGGAGYYSRALALTSVAGIGRLPEVSLPLADVGGVPVGLSLLAGPGQDALLLGAVMSLAPDESAP